jgi:dihydroorotase
MMALETTLGLALKSVLAGHFDLRCALAALSAGPARITGLASSLEVGAPADLVVFDPDAIQRVANCASRARNTPFWGHALPGTVRWTLVGGHVAYDAQDYDTQRESVR